MITVYIEWKCAKQKEQNAFSIKKKKFFSWFQYNYAENRRMNDNMLALHSDREKLDEKEIALYDIIKIDKCAIIFYFDCYLLHATAYLSASIMFYRKQFDAHQMHFD